MGIKDSNLNLTPGPYDLTQFRTCPSCKSTSVVVKDPETFCRACGAIIDGEGPDLPWEKWWPSGRRSLLANIFLHEIRQYPHAGARTIRSLAIANITGRLGGVWPERDPDKRAWYLAVWNSIEEDTEAVETYVRELVAYEQMPREEKERLKRERSRPFIEKSMEGKPATEAQLGLLLALGYHGALPTDRAEASRAISRMKDDRQRRIAQIFAAKRKAPCAGAPHTNTTP